MMPLWMRGLYRCLLDGVKAKDIRILQAKNGDALVFVSPRVPAPTETVSVNKFLSILRQRK